MSPLRRLLVTDLDGTLLGDQRSLRELFALLRRANAPSLAFATGRQHDSAVALLSEWGVDAGDYLIAGVGSEIYARKGASWLPLAWPPPTGRSWNERRIRDLLAPLSLTAQAISSPVKVSYVADAPLAVEVRECLRAAKIPATVIHSHGDLLDVLPPGIDKGTAVMWLAKTLGLAIENVVTCGDTENDLAMLSLTCPSVIVGNARREVRAKAAHLPNVFIARRAHAAGIVEGLRRYGWLRDDAWTRPA